MEILLLTIAGSLSSVIISIPWAAHLDKIKYFKDDPDSMETGSFSYNIVKQHRYIPGLGLLVCLVRACFEITEKDYDSY